MSDFFSYHVCLFVEAPAQPETPESNEICRSSKIFEQVYHFYWWCESMEYKERTEEG